MKRKLLSLACGLLMLATAPLPATAMTRTRSAMTDAGKAYGYLVGQDEALAAIAKQFPDLGRDAEMARLTFNAAFPSVKTRLHEELTGAMGAEQMASFESALAAQMAKVAAARLLTRADAAGFISTVKQRAAGKVEDPAVLAYLLIPRYASEPAAEFAAGFRQKFQTDGSGKALGIELALELPASWKQSAGVRPHIVSKWSAEYGNAPAIVMLDIRDAEGANPSKADIEAALRPGGEIAMSLVELGTVNKSRAFMHEGVAGYVVDMSTSAERATGSVVTRSEMYQIFYRGKAIGIQCAASSVEGDVAGANKRYEAIRPLCAQVMNSLVLMQKYR